MTSRHRRPAAARRGQQLEDQRGLADARLSAEKGDRAGHQAAAEHPVELADAGGLRRGALGIDFGDGQRSSVVGPVVGLRPVGLLQERVPRRTGGAAPDPLRRRGPAFSASEGRAHLGHGRTIRGGYDTHGGHGPPIAPHTLRTVMRLRVLLATLTCALAAAGCASDGARPQSPPTGEAALPPADFADLEPIFESELAPLGVRLTRAALVSTVTRRPSPTGRHLALYVEPVEQWTSARYAETIVPLTALLVTDVFDRWPGLESFDVCQEPPPGVDDRPAPPPVSTVDLTRAASDAIDWDEIDLSGLLAASLERRGGVHVAASEALQVDPLYRDAQAAAEATTASGD